MADAGLFTGEGVELINGDVVCKSPLSPTNSVVIQLVAQALRPLDTLARQVRTQLPMALGRRSEPEPDVAIVEGHPREFLKDHPSTALLIVEVAVSSLAHDRKKAGLYAKAGVPEYWIVDVKHRQVLVHRLPAPMNGRTFKHGYREVMTETDSGQVTALIAPELVIPVRDLLP